MEAMTESLEYMQVNPVALQAAVAPHIAARQEGRNLQVGRLAGLCRGVMTGGADFVLVEGAGGWRVPVRGRQTLADLALELRCDVILVVGMRLGCINHALLTAEAIRRDGLRLAGWVANQPGERMSCHEENLDTLRELLGAPLLGEVPHLAPFDARKAAESLSIVELLGK
jgi:dethiobiotin synthetase